MSFKRIAIVGLGLLGGSIGLAVREHLPNAQTTGFDASEQVRGRARELELRSKSEIGYDDLVYEAILADYRGDSTQPEMHDQVLTLCVEPNNSISRLRRSRETTGSIGIDIIGRAIEVITGKSLATVLSEEIFQPLGMVDTGFGVPESKIARYADCYALTEKNPLMPVDLAPDSEFLADRVETYSGGGGLVSTLHDYFRFGEMIRLGGSLDGHRVVSPRTLAFMRRNHLPGSIASMGPASFAEMPMDGMGFGIGGAMVLDPAIARTPGSVGDFGWGGMASTFFWTDPIEQLSCIFFTQLIPSSAYPNRAELKALVHAAMID